MLVSPELIYSETDSETDEEKINRDFIEKPDDKVGLLAINLARPDGFTKSLICGAIATSEELVSNIGPFYVRTHRGYYMSYPPSLSEYGKNNYLSFSVGLGQQLYAKTEAKRNPDWRKGLGVVVPAETIMADPQTVVNFGYLNLQELRNEVLHRSPQNRIEEKIIRMSDEELKKYDYLPPKEDFLELVQIARKRGVLSERKDQAEINLLSDNNNPARLKLSETLILIPKESKEAFLRLVRFKLQECQEYAQKIFDTFGVNIRSMTPEEVIGKYPNIYWYPQNNIGSAIKYLTTHPNLVKQFIKKIRRVTPDY